MLRRPVEPGGDPLIEVALGNLIAAGVVSLGAKSDVTYPAFAKHAGAVPDPEGCGSTNRSAEEVE